VKTTVNIDREHGWYKNATRCYGASKMTWVLFWKGVHRHSKDGMGMQHKLPGLVGDVYEGTCNQDTAFLKCRDDTPSPCH
jgi:hypothetical protein